MKLFVSVSWMLKFTSNVYSVQLCGRSTIIERSKTLQDLSVCPSFTTLMTAGVEHLLRDAKDNTIGTLSTNVDRMIGGLGTLKSRLLEVQQYLELVVAGKLPVNHDIIYNLQVCSVLSGADKVIGELSFKAASGVWWHDPETVFHIYYPMYMLRYEQKIMSKWIIYTFYCKVLTWEGLSQWHLACFRDTFRFSSES